MKNQEIKSYIYKFKHGDHSPGCLDIQNQLSCKLGKSDFEMRRKLHTAILQEPSYVHTYMGERIFGYQRTGIYDIFIGLQ